MSVFTLTPASVLDGEAVLPLADAKAHLRVVDDTSEDSLIGVLRDAAINLVEQFTGRRLAPATITITANDFARLEMGLGVHPVLSVSSIKYDDSAGAEQTVSASVYRVVHGRQIVRKPGQVWPSDLAGDVPGCVRATCVAGHDGAETPVSGSTPPPQALIVAAKIMLSHLFENRDGIITEGSGGALPPGFEALCLPFRDPVL